MSKQVNKKINLSELKEFYNKYSSEKRKLKELSETAKLIYKLEQTPENKENIVKTYYLRIEVLIQNKDYSAASDLYDTILKVYKNNDMRAINYLDYLRIQLRAHLFQKAVNLYYTILATKNIDASCVIEEIADYSVIYWNSISPLLKKDDAIYTDGLLIRNIIDCFDANDRNNAEDKLKAIGLSSPYKHWKIFIKMYNSLQNEEYAEAQMIVKKCVNFNVFKEAGNFLQAVANENSTVTEINNSHSSMSVKYFSLMSNEQKNNISFLSEELFKAVKNDDDRKIIEIFFLVIDKLSDVKKRRAFTDYIFQILFNIIVINKSAIYNYRNFLENIRKKYSDLAINSFIASFNLALFEKDEENGLKDINQLYNAYKLLNDKELNTQIIKAVYYYYFVIPIRERKNGSKYIEFGVNEEVLQQK